MNQKVYNQNYKDYNSKKKNGKKIIIMEKFKEIMGNKSIYNNNQNDNK